MGECENDTAVYKCKKTIIIDHNFFFIFHWVPRDLYDQDILYHENNRWFSSILFPRTFLHFPGIRALWCTCIPQSKFYSHSLPVMTILWFVLFGWISDLFKRCFQMIRKGKTLLRGSSVTGPNVFMTSNKGWVFL